MEDNFSNSTETWEPVEYTWPLTTMNVLQGLATAAGLPANVLLLILVAATSRLRSLSSVLLVQRAIADVLTLIPFPFIIHARGNRDYQFGQTMCTTLNILFHVGDVASHVFLMAYTLDSYQASHPQHHTLPYRRKTMKVTSTVAWVLAAAAGVAAYFFGYLIDSGLCIFGPLFDSIHLLDLSMQIVLLFILPMVVVWSLVSVALPPRSSETWAELKVEGSPNRRLLLGLASNFTVLHGFYWLVLLPDRIFSLHTAYIITPFAYSLTTFSMVINPVLVICLSEELWQKVTGWLISRRSASVPLQDL